MVLIGLGSLLLKLLKLFNATVLVENTVPFTVLVSTLLPLIID